MTAWSFCLTTWTYWQWKRRLRGKNKVAGAKVNLDKSEGLQLGAWRGGIPLPEPFLWRDGTIRILGMWFGPSLQLERNWLEGGAKVEAQMGTWLRKRFSLKGRAEVCAVHVFPLILYRFPVLPLPKNHRVTQNGGSGNAWSRELLARLETGLPMPILNEGHGLGTFGEERHFSP